MQQLRGRLAESCSAMRDVVVHPQLRRAELAFAYANTGEWALTVGLGVVAYRDGGAVAVGLVALLRMLPSALVAPFLTGFADRMRRERVLIAVSSIRALTIGAAAVLVETGGPTAVMYTLVVVSTIAYTVFRPAHSALLPSLCVTTRELASANVVRGVLDSASSLLGPAIAGVLLAVLNAAAVFVAAALLSLLAAAALVRIRYESALHAAPVRRAPLLRETVRGVVAVTGDRELRLIFGLGFAQTFVRGALNVLSVVLALGLLDTGEPGVAALAAALGAGGLLGSLGVSLLVGSRHLGAWLAIALVLWGGPIAVIGAAPTQAAAFALLAIVGLANAIIDVPLFTLPVRLAPDAVLARVFGVFESLVALGVGLGSVLTPPLIALLGLRGALVATGVTLPVLAVLSWRRLAALDARLGVRDDEIEVLRTAPMLGLLPVPSIEHLAGRVRRHTVPAGTVLVEQGEPGTGFFVIRTGEAEVIGNGTSIGTLGPGESFGEIALVHDIPRTATIRARSPLTIFEIDRADFLDAVAGSRASSDAAHAVVAMHLANFHPIGGLGI